MERLILGEAIEELRKLEDSSIDMVLCDLPYGTTINKWDVIIPFEELWYEINRVTKINAAIVLTSQGVFTAKIIMSNEKYFKYKWVWEKSKATNFLNAKNQPLRKHEDICVFYRKQTTYNPQMSPGVPYNKGARKDSETGSYHGFKNGVVSKNESGDRHPTDVVYFKTAETEGVVFHPTQKPVELGRYFIRTYTNPGDTVLDMTFGSGSFLVAAKMENRGFIGIEKDEVYYIKAVDRLSKLDRPF